MGKKRRKIKIKRHSGDVGICFEPLEPRLLLSGSPGAGAEGPGPDSQADGQNPFAQETVERFHPTDIADPNGLTHSQSVPGTGAVVDVLAQAPPLKPIDSDDTADAVGTEPAAEVLPNAGPTAFAPTDPSSTAIEDVVDRIRQLDRRDGPIEKVLNQEVVFVNDNVADYEQLIAEMNGENGERVLEVVVLESDRDGIEQVSAVLSDRSNLSAVHVITHGADGRISLGNDWLTSTTLQQNSDAVAGWGKALSETGDMLFYGCNIAADSNGQTLLDNIASITGADVSASVDPTGDLEKGGDWELEYVSGAIETESLVPSDSQQDWTHLLAAPSDLQITSTANGGLSINEDGGDDAYLIADDGGAILGGLTALTAEVSFSMDAFPNSTNFFSYATGSDDNVFKFNIRDNGNLSFAINSTYIFSSAMDFRTLADGDQHTLSVTWNSAGGAWEMFVDGVSVDDSATHGTTLASGVTLAGGGTLVMGNDQDSVDGGYDTTSEAAATLYDARIFNVVRSDMEIAANYNSTLPFDETGLAANWTFNDLSTDGVITDTVSGNNLTVKHASGPGFIPSTPELTFSVDENAVDGTVIGSVVGTDADRNARIASLLAADPDLVYSAETGKFYKVVDISSLPADARTSAESTALNGVNGQLVTIRSAYENALVSNIGASAGTSVWIGGTDATVEGEWRWIESGAEADQFWSGAETGDAVNGAYQNWVSASQPNNVGDEDYVRLNTSTGQWWDDKAPSAHDYVIEWKADDVLDATDPLTYTIQSQTVAGAFAIDADSGEITVADGSLLDYDTNATHSVTVRVSDGSNTYDEAFTVSLTEAVEFVVINTDDSGVGSLRQAIIDANASANAGGPDQITFNIGADGSQQTINLLSPLDPISEAVIIDGFSQYGALTATVPIIELNGASAGAVDGIILAAGSDGSTIRGLVINNFGDAGIKLEDSGNHTIVGNYIGTDAAGTAQKGNSTYGIEILNSWGNQIGGSTAADRNVIADNTLDGITIWGAGSTLNVIQGNYIGVDATGNTGLGNGADGIVIGGGANNNTIGGDRTAGEGNVISGQTGLNADGVEIDNAGADNNKIYGNYIGTNFDGTSEIPNARHGVVIYDGVQGTLIGGNGTGQGNIISGNTEWGVVIDGNGVTTTSGNYLQGNYIGLDVAGTSEIGNRSGGGVHIFGGAQGNIIGGDWSAGEGNVISGHGFGNVGIRIAGDDTDNNLIQGNRIGTNAAGTAALANHHGIVNEDADGTVIGGDSAAGLGNLVSGNSFHGVYLSVSTTNVSVQGNLIGTNASGDTALGNGFDGVRIEGGAANNTIGGDQTANLGNVIGGNSQVGVNVNSGDDNKVQGNWIGTNATDDDLGNAWEGIHFDFNSSGNLIGSTTTALANVIAYNSVGVAFNSTAAGTGNSVLGNAIHNNAGLAIDIEGGTEDPNGVTQNDGDDSDTGGNNLQNFPVLSTASTTGSQITITGGLTSNANSYYRIEFFASTSGDVSGYGEGQTYLGFANVATNGSGDATFNALLTVNVADGAVISATATKSDATYANFTDTSEFGPDIAATSAITLTKRVAADSDDAEEEGPTGTTPNRMWLDSSDIELVSDFDSPTAGVQKIGLRFAGMDIPVGATITDAYLVFRAVSADPGMSNSDATSLTLKGQLIGDAPTFTSTSSDISSRTLTNASTAWAPTAWTTGSDYNSPDIASVVQEIVDQGTWASGNDIAIIITGTGHRASQSYDSDPATAAQLVVTYTPAVNDAPTAADHTVTTNEDSTYTFTVADFNYNDADSDPLDHVQITSLESVGSLELSGTPVTLNQTITATQITDGYLKFVPVAGESGTGYDSFQFRVHDGTEYSAAASTVSIVNATFDADSDGFTYADDTFGTSLPAYAAGTYEAAGGNSGGGLRVYLAGAATGGATSGGWSDSFNLATDATVTVSLRYRMLMGEGYETTEYGEVILDIDGTKYGNDTNISLVHVDGNDNGGGTDDTGWLYDEFKIALTAGNHTITIGAYNNGATATDEWVEAFFDDVSVQQLTFNTMTVDVDAANEAPVLSSANALTAINEDNFTNSGTLVSDLIAGQVSDVDSGAVEGIAVIAVDDSNGTWEYTTDGGSNWTAFGAVDAAAARLLAADANTYVRFVPDANWNGTVSSGITFHAWDQTSGTAGGTADLTGTVTVRDEFTSGNGFTGDDGSVSWTGAWQQIGETDGANAGTVTADGTPEALAIGGDDTVTITGDGVQRQVDLSAATSATLTLDVWRSNDTDNSEVSLSVSADGSNWVELEEFDMVNTPDSSPGYSYDISAYASSTTWIRLVGSGTTDAGESNYLYFDNVQIAYQTADGTGGVTAFSANTASSSITVTPVNDAPVAADDPGSYDAHVLSQGPVGYWQLGESSGTTAVNIGSNGVDGIYNGATLGEAGIPGTGGDTAADFDGADDHVDLGTFDVDGTGITLSAWINVDDFDTDDQRIISKALSTGSNATEDHWWMLSTYDNGSDFVLRFRLRAGGTTDTLIASTGNIEINQWHFAAATYDETTGAMRIFLDGVEVGSKIHSLGGAVDQDPTQTVMIGANPNGYGYFDGTIDEVAVFDRALSLSDLQAMQAATSESYTLSEDSSLTVAADQGVLANDSDPENDSLTAALVSGPTNASSFTLNADGSFTYTPDANFSGTDTFTYKANDGSADSNTATVTIEVLSVNDPPVLLTGSVNNLTVSEDSGLTSLGLESVSYGPGGGSDESSQSLTYGVTVIPAPTSGDIFLADGTTRVTTGTYTLAQIQGMQFKPASDWSGTTAFQFNVTDSGGTANGGSNSISQFILITVTQVDDVGTFGGDTSGTGAEDGGAVTGTLTFTDAADGASTPNFTVTGAASNGSASIDSGSGAWTYTPAANFNGSDSFTVTVTDDDGNTQTQVISITVSPVDDSGTFGGDTSGTGAEDGGAITGTLTFTDAADGATAPNFTVTALAANGTATIDSGSGAWSYTPAANFNGTDSFTVTVTDDDGNTQTQVISITVTPVDDLGTFGGDTSGSGLEDGGAITGTLTFTDAADGATTPNFTVTSTASNGTASIDSGSGAWTYTPDANFNGTDSFTVTVTDDDGNTQTQVIGITVTQVDDAGTFGGNTSGSGAEDGGAISGTLTFTDAADGATAPNFTVTGVAGNGTATINSGSGAWTHTPNANFNGTDTFTVTVTDDDGNTQTQVISITVTPAGDLTGADDSFSVDEDGSLSGDVSLNDSTTSGGTLSYAIATDVSNGSLTLNIDGSFTYDPNGNYNGADSFTYTVTDLTSGESSTQSVTITVNQIDDAGSFGGDTSGSGTEDGGAITGTLTFTDAADGATAPNFTVTGVAGNGTATINSGTGAWTYTPAANFNGNDTFTVTVTDDDGNTQTQVISITVSQVDDAGTFGGDLGATIDEDNSASGTLTFTDAADGMSSPNYTIGTDGTNGTATINATTGNWSYTPNANWSGTDSFTVSVTDDDGNVESQIISITVNPVVDLTATDDSFSVDEDTTLSDTVAANDSTTSGGALSYSLDTDVTNGSLTLNADGSFSYTPTANYNGSDSFTCTVTDAASGESATQTVTITVTPVNDAATVSSDSQTLTETDAPLTTSGTLTSTDVDNPDDTFTPATIVGTIGTFDIDGAGNWTFTANSAFDSLNVGDNVNETFNVTSVDGTASTVTIQIDGTNDAATVSSASQTLTETDAPLSTSGTLTSTDVDNPDDSFTAATIVGTIGTFDIDGAGAWTFTANSAFDNLNVGDNVSEIYTVTSIDGTSSTVTIRIDGTNDAATVSSASQTLTETDAALSTSGTLTSTDVDNTDDSFTAATIVGTIGTFDIDGAGAWTFTANSAFDNLNVGDNVSETFNVASVDGTASTVFIRIDGTNDAATVSSASQTLTETDAALSTSGTLTSTDVDNTDDSFTAATIVGTIGTFDIDGAGNWTFTANSAFDSLNVGDNVNETFNVTSVDGTASTVTIQIDGTNDAATVSSASQTLTETDAPLSTSGTLTSTDVDNPDDSFTAATIVGTIGTFDIDGAGAWTFTANSAFDNLNVGDNINETFNVTSVDGTASTVFIRIDGTNDAATVSSDSQTLTETDAALTTSGTLTSSDPDNADDSFTADTIVGTIGTFDIDAAGAWSFTANSAFDNLNVGDNVSETFNVASVDGTASTVFIRINGTNDAATVSSASQTLTETDAALSTSGTLTSTDVDNTDDSFTAATIVGTIGTFDIDGAGNWTFTANSAFDSLNVGDNVNETFNVTSVDGTASTVTIQIDGTNDAATVSSASQTLTETDAPLSTSGTLTSTDVDNPDDSFTAATIVGTIGTFDIDGAGAWTFTANSAFDNLNVGDNINETFNVTSVDGTASTVFIRIDGTNDAATVSSASQTLTETDAALSTSGTLTSSDVDNPDDSFTADTIVGTIGTFDIDGAGAWTFTANSAFDSLNVGDNVSEIYTVTSIDGTSSTVTIRIDGTNDAATVSSASQTLTETDAALSTSGTLTSSDVDNPDDSFTADTIVGTIGTFDIDGSGNWTFTANSAFDNLNVGDNVSETFNVTSVDGTASTVFIQIDGTNDAATVSSASQTLVETDAALTTSGTLTSTDVDNPDDSFTADTIVGTIGTFDIDGSGNWTFTANSAFDNLNVGDNVSEIYTVTSIDGTSSTVTIRIDGTNDAATVSSDSQTLTETDAALTTSGTLTSSDPDNADDSFTADTIVGTIGTFDIDAAGAWSFTANSAFDNLNVGDNVSETFNVASVDGTASSVQITINGTNDAPTIESTIADQSLSEDFAGYTIDLNAAFADAETADNALIYGVSGNTAVNVSIVGGIATITSTAGWNGIETLTFTATDGGGLSVSQDVVFAVAAVNDAPTIEGTIADQSLSEDFAGYTIDLNAAFADAETADNALIYGVSGNTAVNVSIAGGIATITPTADWNGSETLTFTATDGGGLSVSQYVVFAVAAVADIADDPAVVVVEDTATIIAVLSNDSFDGIPMVTATSSPSHGAVVINGDNTITYTPALNYNGADSFTYTVTSGGVTETATVTVDVTAVNDPATVSSASQTLTETDAALTTSGTLTSTDVDNADDSFTADTIVGTIGTFDIDAAGAWTFTANSAFDSLNVGDNVNETIYCHEH